MAIVFAVRGDKFDARYSNGGKTPVVFTNSGAGGYAEITTAQPGINGVSSIDLYGTNFASPGGGWRSVLWNGGLNTPADRARSILLRFRMNDLAIAHALFNVGADMPLPYNAIGARLETTGEIRFDIYNEVGQNFTVTSTTASITAGVWYDLLVTWTGTTVASGFRAYLNGTSIINATSTRELLSPFDAIQRSMVSFIVLGVSPVGTRFSSHWVDELVVWDTALANATVDLTSGSGSLNGAARTAYVAVDEFDGQAASGGGSSGVTLGSRFGFGG